MGPTSYCCTGAGLSDYKPVWAYVSCVCVCVRARACHIYIRWAEFGHCHLTWEFFYKVATPENGYLMEVCVLVTVWCPVFRPELL